MTVRTAVIGGRAAGADPLRYVLDGGRARRGAARFIFRNLAPGRHHLVVILAGSRSIQADTSFLVRRPPPAPTPPPAPAPTTATTTQAPAPPPATTTPQQPPPTTTPKPPPSGGIPQGGGGDGDSDNHGGPSDGDGNV